MAQFQVRQVFSSGRKFAGYETHDVLDPQAFSATGRGGPAAAPDAGRLISCNPFALPADKFALDLLTDSGTGRLSKEQATLAAEYRRLVPSIEMFSYARSTPREHLDEVSEAWSPIHSAADQA